MEHSQLPGDALVDPQIFVLTSREYEGHGHRKCRLRVNNGSQPRPRKCPFLGVEQTSFSADWRSAFSQKRKFRPPIQRLSRELCGKAKVGQVRTIWLLDGCGGEIISMTARKSYDHTRVD